MTKGRHLKLPNGAAVSPHMIAVCSPTTKDVALTSAFGRMIGFIEIDSSKYQVEKLKLLIMNLIIDCCDQGKNFKQIDWNSAFYSCERVITHID
jgi:hypothetical protein